MKVKLIFAYVSIIGFILSIILYNFFLYGLSWGLILGCYLIPDPEKK